MTNETSHSEAEATRATAAIHVAETELKVDLRSPEFIIAYTVIILFGASLFLYHSEQLQTALISSVSMALGYFLGSQRQRKVDPYQKGG
jgi:hypothetical protein